MSLGVYLNFPGNSLEAIKFYEDVFGVKVKGLQQFKDMPPNPNFPIPEEMVEKVINSQLFVNDGLIMISDSPSHLELNVGNNIMINYLSKDSEELTKVFNGLKEGGNIVMDLGPQFFSKLYGYVIDKFGIGWQLNLQEDLA